MRQHHIAIFVLLFKVMSFPKQFTNAKEALIDYTKLKAVESTWYSSEHPVHFKQIDEIIYEEMRFDCLQSLTVLDGTAHVGGFSLNWATAHPTHKIDSVELNKNTYDALVYNIRALNLEKQIQPIHADVNQIIRAASEAQFDFVYLDAEWGGPEYKRHTDMHLFLGDRDVSLVVQELLQRKITSIVFLKVPNNYDKTVFSKYTQYPISREARKDPAFSILVIRTT